MMAKKGGIEIGNILLVIIGLIISLVMFVTVAGEFIWSAQRDVETIARQTAKSFASEVSAISVVGQGVRFFETSTSFTITLEEKRFGCPMKERKNHMYLHTRIQQLT